MGGPALKRHTPRGMPPDLPMSTTGVGPQAIALWQPPPPPATVVVGGGGRASLE